jgi:hypothetical protein
MRIGSAILALAAVAGAFGLAGTASAAKPEPLTIELDCGDDGTLTVELVPGNGTFTPAKVVGGGTLIPVAFSNQHGTFTDNAGNVEEFDEPGIAKGGPHGKDFMDCHFVVTFEEPEGTGTFEGDVRAFIAGH